MRVGIIGTGRMGKILAQRLARRHEVFLYDADPAAARAAAAALGLQAVAELTEQQADSWVLAVPDMAIKPCIEMLLAEKITSAVFSVATNISREMLAEMAGATLNCLNVKIIGHAGEMGLGCCPVIVVDDADAALAQIAVVVFEPAGNVLIAEADLVKTINSIATAEALKAAVALEQALCAAGIGDQVMINGALSQVAPGVLKAYAEDDLGPFARGIVCALRDEAGAK